MSDSRRKQLTGNFLNIAESVRRGLAMSIIPPRETILNDFYKKLRKETQGPNVERAKLQPIDEFVTEDSLDTIFSVDNLRPFVKEVLLPNFGGSSASEISSIINEIRGTSRAIDDGLIKILATFITFNSKERDWSWFVDLFIEKKDRRDKNLPFNEEDLNDVEERLGNPAVMLFKNYQYKFIPIIITAHKFEYQDSMLRFPFLEFHPRDEYQVGKGAYGEVYKCKIAKGCVVTDKQDHGNSANTEPIYLAFKKVPVSIKPDGGQPEKERKIVAKIAERRTLDMAIQVFIGTVKRDDYYYFFQDLADLNLDEYLFGTSENMRAQHKECLRPELIRENLKQMYRLVDAFSRIHEFEPPDPSDTTIEGQQYSYIHSDVKPLNVLVFWNGCRQGSNSAPIVERAHKGLEQSGRWKISDFGISKMKKINRKATAQNQDGSFHPSRESYRTGSAYDARNPASQNIYTAPECHNNEGQDYGLSADVWSLGCIFVFVVAYCLGGQKYAKSCQDKIVSLKLRTFYDPPTSISPNTTRLNTTAINIIKDFRKKGSQYRWIPKCLDIIMGMLEINTERRSEAFKTARGSLHKLIKKSNQDHYFSDSTSYTAGGKLALQKKHIHSASSNQSIDAKTPISYPMSNSTSGYSDIGTSSTMATIPSELYRRESSRFFDAYFFNLRKDRAVEAFKSPENNDQRQRKEKKVSRKPVEPSSSGTMKSHSNGGAALHMGEEANQTTIQPNMVTGSHEKFYTTFSFTGPKNNDIDDKIEAKEVYLSPKGSFVCYLSKNRKVLSVTMRWGQM